MSAKSKVTERKNVWTGYIPLFVWDVSVLDDFFCSVVFGELW